MKQMMNESLYSVFPDVWLFKGNILFLNFSIFHTTLIHESNSKKAPFLLAPSNNKNMWEIQNYKGCLQNTSPCPAHLSIFLTSKLLRPLRASAGERDKGPVGQSVSTNFTADCNFKSFTITNLSNNFKKNNEKKKIKHTQKYVQANISNMYCVINHFFKLLPGIAFPVPLLLTNWSSRWWIVNAFTWPKNSL